MPTITTSSSSDYSPLSLASSADEEVQNDVLFATLFGAVVSSEDEEDTNIDFEMLPGLMSDEQFNSEEGEKKFVEALLFVGSEDPVLDNADGTAISPICDPLIFEEKEEVEAGILAATQMPVQAQPANARFLRTAGERPLTTQLLTEIAEDLAPEHVVVKQKVSMNTAQTAVVNDTEMLTYQSDKALPVMIGPRQHLGTKFKISKPVFTETPKVELGVSTDEMIDALTLKTASQATLSSRAATPQLPTTETTTLLQGGIGSQAGSSAGNQSAGGQTGSGQTGSGQTGLSSSMAENWLEMLDMQDENWAEQLVKRVERNLANAKEGIDFELNPRSLGKLHVNLSLQQNEAQLQMRTETSQAGQMITDAQSRLSAMLEDAGMKLAYLGTSTQSNGNGANGQQSGNAHHSRQNSGKNNDSDLSVEQNNDATDVSSSLVNVKA